MRAVREFVENAALVSVERPRVDGKFLNLAGDKFHIKGVTYGPLRPFSEGGGYHDPQSVRRDFSDMTRCGINAVRVYNVPPEWMLDAAQEYGLRVMVGLPWEQHVCFLDDRRLTQSIEDRVRAGVKACAKHPAVFCYAVGNEIPASIVRWHGRRRIEKFLERLYGIAKHEDPEALVTYVNYPTTEYLQLSFLDVVCFNVYLEEKKRLQSYLSRLQNLAEGKPLVMAEIGLDSRSHGQARQADALAWQVQTAVEAGCAGTFVFSWTDEWHRGGHDITDWDFGLTDRRRRPKKALAAVESAYREHLSAAPNDNQPFISVAVCVYNGAATIGQCLDAISRLNYPNYEVIVVDDGSTDATASIVRKFAVQLIRVPNGGLSHARNLALEEAAGEIIAYIDSDAYPDPDWLSYLAHSFRTSRHVGIGGPNILPPAAGMVETCVDSAPGGPTHVLFTDDVAEHIPGCNMAFRVKPLEEIGGFDHQFRIAGDDVDVCWQLYKRGETLGFHPGAVVWHHRRQSLRGYWKQQLNYGRAEAMLEWKWPEKYSRFGHPIWQGRIYSDGHAPRLNLSRSRIYHGIWGTSPFQSVYSPARAGTLLDFPLMPEWFLVMGALALLSLLGVWWSSPLLVAVPFLIGSLAAFVVPTILHAVTTRFEAGHWSRRQRLGMRLLIAWLHVQQPLARLIGRVSYDLTPWKKRGESRWCLPFPSTLSLWSESWTDPVEWLVLLESKLHSYRAAVARAGAFDDWDLDVWGGPLGGVRARAAFEEHGDGKQLVRFRIWPKFAWGAVGVSAFLGGLAVAAAASSSWLAFGLAAAAAGVTVARSVKESCASKASMIQAVEELGETSTQ